MNRISTERLAEIETKTYDALSAWENIGGASDADRWAETHGDELISIALELIRATREDVR